MAEPVSSSPPFPSPSPSTSPANTDKGSGDLWYVGAIINVVGSVSINLGMNMMKLGHTRRAKLEMPEEEKPPIRKFKVWLFGMIIFITGNILNFVSFAFAAQSLLAALGSLQLVCNVFFAYFVNHEPVTKIIILSTACIIGGCVLLVVFGNQSSETYTVEQLIHFYTLPAYVVYLVMMGVFVFGFYVLYLHSKKVCRKRGESGIWYGLMLVSYAIFSALLGSQSVLFGKSISVILRTTFTESNQLGNWYTWVVLPLFTFTALFWVTRLNKGLRMFPAMVIVPLLQIAWTLFSIVSGMIYFQEYKGFNTLKAIMFPVGVLIVFLGVFLLTVCGGGKPPPEEEEEGTKEEGDDIASLPTKTSVYDNAVFSARPDGDGHGPDGGGVGGASWQLQQQTQSKISLGQTLRFMSTWAPPSVAVSPASNLNRTLAPNESLQAHHLHYQQQHRRRTAAPSDLNATDITSPTDDLAPTTSVAPTPAGADAGEGAHPGGWGNRTYDRNSTLNRTAQSTASRVSETSMVSTMRRGLKSVGSRLTADMGLDMSGFKLAVGLGDSNLAGVSLFAMPALDFTATARRKSEQHRPSRAAPRQSENSILNALPRSRFYEVEDGLTVIRETSGAPGATKPPSPELGASLTASSQLPASSAGSQGAAAAGSPDTGRHTPGRQQQQQQRAASPSPAGRSPGKPLTEAAMLSLLPVPSFQTSRPQPQQQQQPGEGGSGGGAGPQASDPSNKTSAPASPPRPGAIGPGGGGGGAGGGSPRGGPNGRAQRSRRPSAALEPAGLPPPGFRTPPQAATAGQQSGGGAGGGYESDAAYPATWAPSAVAAVAPLQQQFRASQGPGPGLGQWGGVSASYDAGQGGGWGGGGGGGGGRGQRGGGSSLPKPGSLGALLPEGVPLSTANSVVMHESVPSTPPDAAMIAMMQQQLAQQQQQLDRWAGTGAGAGTGTGSAAGYVGGGGLQGPLRSQSPWQQRLPATPSQQVSLQQQLSPHQQYSLQQQLSLQQQQQQHIPLSMLQRAQAPPMVGTARLPPLHLIVPGLPVSPSQLAPPAAAPTAGSGYLQQQYGTSGSTMSYAQMLAAQGYTADGGTVGGQLAGSMSLGGAPPGGGVAPTAVRVQGRAQSPYGALSVSRSWAGLSGLSAGGASAVASAAARQSPLRGALVGHMQRPLRPWQN